MGNLCSVKSSTSEVAIEKRVNAPSQDNEDLKRNQDRMLSGQANISEGLNGMKDLLIEHEFRIMSRIEGLREFDVFPGRF